MNPLSERTRLNKHVCSRSDGSVVTDGDALVRSVVGEKESKKPMKKTDREEFEEMYREHRKDRFDVALRDPLRTSMCSFDYVDGVTQSDWDMFLLGKGTFHEWYPKND